MNTRFDQVEQRFVWLYGLMVALLLLATSTSWAAETTEHNVPRPAILRYSPFDESDIEPGTRATVIAQYGRTGRVVDIVVDTDTLREVSEHRLLPDDTDLVMSWTYLLLSHGSGTLDHRYLLAKNLLQIFPLHPLSESIHAALCQLTCDYETRTRTDIKQPLTETIKRLEQHLQRWPHGAYTQAIKWELLKQQNLHFAFMTGSTKALIDEINLYKKFLKDCTDEQVSEEVKFRIAHLYRSAYETLIFDTGLGKEEGYTTIDATRFRENAKSIYQDLLTSSNPITRETARIKNHSLEAGRRVYYNSNDW